MGAGRNKIKMLHLLLSRPRDGMCDMVNGAAAPIQDHFGQVAIVDQPALLMSVNIVQVKEALKVIFRVHRAPMVAFSKYCC